MEWTDSVGFLAEALRVIFHGMDGQCWVLIVSTEGHLVFMEWTDSVGFLAEALRVIFHGMDGQCWVLGRSTEGHLPWNGQTVLGSYHKY